MKDLEVKMNEIESEREVLEKQILNLIMKIDHKVDQIEGTWWKIQNFETFHFWIFSKNGLMKMNGRVKRDGYAKVTICFDPLRAFGPSIFASWIVHFHDLVLSFLRY